MSKTTGDQIVEYVYLQSYEELRKGGKDEEEAYEFAMKVSTSVQRVIENKIALRAVVLFLKSSYLYRDEDDDRNSDDDILFDDRSSRSSGDEQDECHVIPIK